MQRPSDDRRSSSPSGYFGKHQLTIGAVCSDSIEDRHRCFEGALAEIGQSSLVTFLSENGLGSVWHNLATSEARTSLGAPALSQALAPLRYAETAMYAGQQTVLREVDDLFARKKITYVVIKGAHVRELVYADPSLRPAADIDLLVRPNEREAAVRRLLETGFQLHPDPDNISHEVMLTKGPVIIDLHWDIMRPGRTRIPATDEMLERRVRVESFWAPDESDAVFLMLTHPAFTKYVCSRNMSLVSAVDFMLWSKQKKIDWEQVEERLERTGLKTAAWTILTWFAMLGTEAFAQETSNIRNRLQPYGLRKHYLEYWISNNLPDRWLANPLLIQLGLTLFLHDEFGDARTAVSGWIRSRMQKRNDPILGL